MLDDWTIDEGSVYPRYIGNIYKDFALCKESTLNLENVVFNKTLFEQIQEKKEKTNTFSGPFMNITLPQLTINGKLFADIPSLEWLAAAVKEKMNRENSQPEELVKVMHCNKCTHYAKLPFADRGICIRNGNAVWPNDYCSYACTHEELLK